MIADLFRWFVEHSGPILVSLWLVGATLLATRQVRPKTLSDKIRVLLSLGFMIFVFVVLVEITLSSSIGIFFSKAHPLLQDLWFVVAIAVVEYSSHKEWVVSSKYFAERNPRLFQIMSKNKESMIMDRIMFEAFIKFFGFFLLNIAAAILLYLFKIFLQTI